MSKTKATVDIGSPVCTPLIIGPGSNGLGCGGVGSSAQRKYIFVVANSSIFTLYKQKQKANEYHSVSTAASVSSPEKFIKPISKYSSL